MKKLLLIGLIGFLLVGCENKKGTFLETVESNYDVPSSVHRLVSIVKKKGLTHFQTIDHAKNAESVGMRMKPETVVVFGNPKVGTKLMICNPSIGLDLPLKILFSTSYEGKTTISYTNPEYWTLKHNIKDKKCLAIINNMSITMQMLTEKIAK